jgi:hypothetical protein
MKKSNNSEEFNPLPLILTTGKKTLIDITNALGLTKAC